MRTFCKICGFILYLKELDWGISYSLEAMVDLPAVFGDNMECCWKIFLNRGMFTTTFSFPDYKPDCQNEASRSTEVSSPEVEVKPDMNHAESTELYQSVSDNSNSSDASAEAQITYSEQITYAFANNDLKRTKSHQEADISFLYKLAMAITDYRGHRDVAQIRYSYASTNVPFPIILDLHSIIHGILQGDKSDSFLYSYVDNGKKEDVIFPSNARQLVLAAAGTREPHGHGLLAPGHDD